MPYVFDLVSRLSVLTSCFPYSQYREARRQPYFRRTCVLTQNTSAKQMPGTNWTADLATLNQSYFAPCLARGNGSSLAGSPHNPQEAKMKAAMAGGKSRTTVA